MLKNHLSIKVLAFFITTTFATGCITNQPSSDKITSPMQGTMELGGDAQHSYGQYTLDVKIWSSAEAPNTTLTITLPSGITLVNGDLMWKGDMQAKEIHVQRVIVNIAELNAPVEVQVDALSVPNPGRFWYGRGLSMYFRPNGNSFFDISDRPYPQENQAANSNSNPVIEPTKDPSAPTVLP